MPGKFMLHAKKPPDCELFAKVFQEFRLAHSISLGPLIEKILAELGSEMPDAEELVRLKAELSFADLDFMFRAFLDMLEEQDVTVVLAHDDHGFAPVAPRAPHMAEVIPAQFDTFIISGPMAEMLPIAKSHNGATIWLPKKAAEAVRGDFPAAEMSDPAAAPPHLSQGTTSRPLAGTTETCVPTKREEVREAFNALYPDGRRRRPWNEVQKKIHRTAQLQCVVGHHQAGPWASAGR